MIHTLTYTSRATQRLNRTELIELAALSRTKNRHLGITGLLLYKQESFMQILEGDHDAVSDLFDEIRLDERHRDVLVIHRADQNRRLFPDWSMAAFNLHDGFVDYLPGYSEYSALPLTDELFRTHPARTREMLSSFSRGPRRPQ